MTNERFARLMAGLLAGDRSALREVYEAYAGLVYALPCRSPAAGRTRRM